MGYQGSNGLLFQITVVRLAKGMLFLPFFAAIFCIVWSIIFDFESSTSTHCRVSNTNSILIRIESGSFRPRLLIVLIKNEIWKIPLQKAYNCNLKQQPIAALITHFDFSFFYTL
jgi:hypothetical protein